MVEALRRQGCRWREYLLFAGERHGFRKAENIERALGAPCHAGPSSRELVWPCRLATNA